MTTTLIPIIVMIAIAITSTFLCASVYRDEDRQRMYDRAFKIVSRGKPFIYICWGVAALFAILILLLHKQAEGQKVVGIVGMTVSAFCLAAGFYHRDSYYTADNESLTYVRHKNVRWTIKWHDIAHIYRRIISTGKTTTILYDIEMKDGEIYKNQPQMIGRILKEHFPIERYNINRSGIIAIIMFIILVLLAFLLS
ncbi:MAG: hypothetical protein Q4F34_07810 [Prevotellaceae bacterium]|nr:hypothetical protein [Prevotellaceae bacterium]